MEAGRRRITQRGWFDIAPLSQTLPTGCSQLVQGTIEKAATAAGLSSTRLPSGAGHDGVFVARIAPMGMIFRSPVRTGEVMRRRNGQSLPIAQTAPAFLRRL